MIKTSLVFYLNEIGSRSNLEDAIYPPPGQADALSRLFIVCDGVGGLSKGEEASRIVSTTLGNTLSDPTEVSEHDVLKALGKSQEAMRSYISQHPEAANMSTTLTLAALRKEDILIAWSGDSRVMHLRDGDVIYQTSDHSMVRHLVQSGQITEEEAATHPKRNIILRAVNADLDPDDPDFKILNDIRDGDWLLLCTDGVLENLNAESIKSILGGSAGETEIRKAFDELCTNKTNDNYSLYLIHLSVTGSNQAPPTPPTPTVSPPLPKKTNTTPLFIYIIGFAGMLLAGFLIWHFSSETEKPVLPSAPVAQINSDAGFPGGNKAWMLYCSAEIHYPKSALKKRIQGWAAVRFKVDSSGNPSEFERLSHLNHGMEKELERVIKEAKWMPAKENNIPVKDTLTIGWQYVLPDSIGGGIKPF